MMQRWRYIQLVLFACLTLLTVSCGLDAGSLVVLVSWPEGDTPPADVKSLVFIIEGKGINQTRRSFEPSKKTIDVPDLATGEKKVTLQGVNAKGDVLYQAGSSVTIRDHEHAAITMKLASTTPPLPPEPITPTTATTTLTTGTTTPMPTIPPSPLPPLQPSCDADVDGPGEPAIEFTDVPPYGSFNDHKPDGGPDDLKGKVSHVKPKDYKVAVYIYVPDIPPVSGWWTKPTFATPLTSIACDGTWRTDIMTGGVDETATKIVAYLVPNGYSPPLAEGMVSLPSELDSESVPRVEKTRMPPGSLDTTFGAGGMVMTDFKDSGSGAYVSIQSDGKIVLAGSASNGLNDAFVLVRYTPNGSLDTTFGTNGKVMIDFGGSNNAYSSAIQPDGKIVIAGKGGNGSNNSDFALARYKSDGSLDTSFGPDGKIMTDFGISDAIDSVAIQPDGKIVVLGHVYYGGLFVNTDLVIARYNSDGSLDNTFGTGGRIIADFGGGRDIGYSVVIQPDEKIIVSGGSFYGSPPSWTSYNFFLMRYSTNGSIDTNFGTNGNIIADFGGSLAIQSDGKIILAGDMDGNFAITRYNSNGSPDTIFGTGGNTITDFGGNDDGNSVAIQSDGKIVVTGSTNYTSAVARYNQSGLLDTTFGIDGKVRTDFKENRDIGWSVAIQSDGKIVIGGVTSTDFSFTRSCPCGGLVVARYNP